MANEVLSREDYVKILQSKFKTKAVFFKNAVWTPLSENIEGFMGDHFILKLEYTLENQEDIIHFFIKTKPMKTEIQREMVSEFLAYEKEIFLYNYLFKEFEKLGYDTKFAPKSYYCKNTDTLVMDDLKIKDFKLFKRDDFYNVEHCKVALRALATYHANSISYEEHKSKELGRTFRIGERSEVFKEFFFIPGDKLGLGFKFFDSAIECCIKLLQIMPESQEWKSSFERRLRSFDVAKIFMKPLPYRKACGHGDLWSNNMLFKYSNGVPTNCCLVDFQLLRYHHPAFDVLLLIYENTRRDFRKKYMKDLLDYYYDSLEDILKRNGYGAKTILPKDHFLKSAEHLEPVALFQAAATRTVTLIPPNVLSSAVNFGGDDLKNIMFSAQRGGLVLEAIEKNDEPRNIIFDDMYDLNEHI